ncbi:hypothetical protein T11_16821 [Trichinella zimbabwensis]|uniref:Uncharacterized protein n=1 Tax=Trichinella zimbabwensis TaxID=268475 RepID=A0A0V1DNI9_9BILA|nr:hypothetical protein T11_13242 [Trichinella zimbabwensis]KRY62875.1 hypothetical protein T11_16821 [Trichinella zimbabwensis]
MQPTCISLDTEPRCLHFTTHFSFIFPTFRLT